MIVLLINCKFLVFLWRLLASLTKKDYLPLAHLEPKRKVCPALQQNTVLLSFGVNYWTYPTLMYKRVSLIWEGKLSKIKKANKGTKRDHQALSWDSSITLKLNLDLDGNGGLFRLRSVLWGFTNKTHFSSFSKLFPSTKLISILFASLNTFFSPSYFLYCIIIICPIS